MSRRTSARIAREHPLSDDEYDPHEHREVAKATTDFETLVHMMKGSLGTGILAMPEAFRYAGLITGTIATIVIGIICTYSLHVLVKAQYELCIRKRVPLLSYPDSMQIALEEGPHFLRPLARSANITVDVFLIAYQLGVCCVYILFVGTSLKSMCDPYVNIKVEIWLLISLGPLIGMNLIRSLKILAPFSILANLMTFASIGILMYYLVTNLQPTENLSLWGNAYTFPLYFGTMLFAVMAVGVIIALEGNMESPKSFGGYCGVLNIGMGFVVALYTLVGFLGYMRYGDKCEGSITLNLPAEPLVQSMRGIYAGAVFITYGLQCYVPVNIIWKTYMLRRLENSKAKLLWEIGLRVGLVLTTVLLAVAIPRLGLFITLFGALCLSALGISFPALIELCVNYPDNFGRYQYILVKDILLFSFGVIGLVSGTYIAMLEIVISFQE